VVVERVLELLGQSLDLEALLLEGITQAQDLFLVLRNLAGLRLLDLQFALVLADLVAKELDVLKALIVLHLTLGEGDLEDLDLLVKKSQLIVSADQLGTEDITLSHERGVGLLGDLMLLDSLLDKAVELVISCIFSFRSFSEAFLSSYSILFFLSSVSYSFCLRPKA